jgi:hypothetical protein
LGFEIIFLFVLFISFDENQCLEKLSSFHISFLPYNARSFLSCHIVHNNIPMRIILILFPQFFISFSSLTCAFMERLQVFQADLFSWLEMFLNFNGKLLIDIEYNK